MIGHDAGKSAPGDRRYVAIEYHGARVWGRLSDETGEFTPDRVDPASFVPPHTWRNRSIGRDFYTYTVVDDGGRDRQVTVRGTWSQPFAGDSTKVFRTEDGRLEWAPAPASTDPAGYDVHEVIGPDALHPFVWDAPDVLAAGLADPWATWQFASRIAREAFTRSQATGTTGSRPRVHTHESAPGRAAAVRGELIDMVGGQLAKIAQRRGMPPESMPDAASLFTPATTRAHGRTRFWIEDPLPAGSLSIGPDDFTDPSWLAPVRESLHRADEGTPNLSRFVSSAPGRPAALPAGLLDAVRQRPYRQFIVLDRDMTGAVPAQDVRRLNLTLEQFRSGGLPVTVIVRGKVGDGLRRVLSTYGDGVVLEVTKGFANGFAAVRARGDAAFRPDHVSGRFDVALLDAAARTAAPADDLAPVDEALGGWFFGLRTDVRGQHEMLRAQWHRLGGVDIHRQIDAMIARVPDETAVARLKSLVTFGPETDFVPRFLTTPQAERPAVIVGEFGGRLATGTAGTADFVQLADAATRGSDDRTTFGYGPFVTDMMLQSVAKAGAGQFDDAQQFITVMKRGEKLDPEQMQAWSAAIEQLVPSMPAARHQLLSLQAAIFACA